MIPLQPPFGVERAVDSPAIESFLTEDSYHARAPYADAMVDTRRTIVQFTSNRADITKDLANRSSCVRILKQPEGYVYMSFFEGDSLAHVRANQPLYLGAVFAVIQSWWQAGRLRTGETRHDFRGWVQTLDWICQNTLGTCPVMDGHRDTQARITTPVLNWLRDIALVVKRQSRLGEWLRTHEIIELIRDDPGVELPGLRDDADLDNEGVHRSVLQACGRRLKKCFQQAEHTVIEGIQVRRRVLKVDRPGGYGGQIDAPEYCFTPAHAPVPSLTNTELKTVKSPTCTEAPDVSDNIETAFENYTTEETEGDVSAFSVGRGSSSQILQWPAVRSEVRGTAPRPDPNRVHPSLVEA